MNTVARYAEALRRLAMAFLALGKTGHRRDTSGPALSIEARAKADALLLSRREVLAAEYARLRRQKRRAEPIRKALYLATNEALRKNSPERNPAIARGGNVG